MADRRGAVRRVAITGAEGTIGTVLRRRLGALYHLVPITRGPARFVSHVADVTRVEDLTQTFRGVDSVVHLAGASRVDDSWERVLQDNIVGTYSVLEAARQAGVRRVVLASSNHTIGMYEVDAAPELYELEDTRTLDVSVPPRPDSLYGASKLFLEAVGRLYADRYGLAVVCLRIGTVVGDDDPLHVSAGRPFPPLPELSADEARKRMRATWLSHRDCAELFRCALEADVRWAVVFGTSGNPRRLWDLEETRRLLGYVPQDSAPA